MVGQGLALWWIPPADVAARVQERIDALAARLGSPGFSAHVTLLSGLPPSRAQAPDPEALLARVSALTGRPCLRPGRITTAATWNRCLVVELGAAPDLDEARRRTAEFLSLPAPGPFRPHLSLAYGQLPAEQRQELVRETAPRLSPFTPGALALVDTRGPVADWRTLYGISV